MNTRKTGKADAVARKGVNEEQPEEKMVRLNHDRPYLGGEERTKTDYERILAYNFRTYRNNHGWSQEQMAEKLRINQSSVANLENGRRCPKLNTIALYCQRLGVDLIQMISSPMENIFDVKSADAEFIKKFKKPKSIISVVSEE